jgi:hypothetical protein
MLCFEQLGANFEHFGPKLCLSPTLVLMGVSHPVLRPALHNESGAQKKLGANFEHFWPKLCLSPTLVLIGVSYPVLRPAFYTMSQGPKKTRGQL